MTVKEFIELCETRGLHFTANWVKKRLRELQTDKWPAKSSAAGSPNNS